MEIAHCGFFHLRVPYLPVTSLNRLNELNETSEQDYLLSVFSKNDLATALYIASPELYQEYSKLMASPIEFSSEKKKAKITASLYKYLMRMAVVPIPFGMFAGTATGRTTNQTNITLRNNNEHRLMVRPDFSVAFFIAEYILQLPEYCRQLKFYPNSTIYKGNGTYRYFEPVTYGSSRQHYLAAVDISEYLNKVLEYAKEGRLTEELVMLLTTDGFNKDVAAAYVNSLVTNRIVISELEPNVTGETYFATIKNKLRTLNDPLGLHAALEKIEAQLSFPRFSVMHFEEVKKNISDAFPTFEQSGNWMQGDLYLQSEAVELGEQILNDLSKLISDLFVLFKNFTSANLHAFKKRFAKKYDQQEVPLTEVLDPDIGIGYPKHGTYSDSPPVVIGKMNACLRDADSGNTRGSFENIINSKILAAMAGNCYNITITEDNLKQHLPEKGNFPDHFYVSGQLLAGSFSDIDNGNYQFYVERIEGASGVNLLTRFCFADTVLRTETEKYITTEELQAPDDAVYAEIVHVAKIRNGNILQRPAFRQYEIPYLSSAGVRTENSIMVDDLYISIKNSEIFLRSKKLNKRVIPRMTCAHNYNHGLDVYRFLCDVQDENELRLVSMHKWMPEGAVFSPRITYKNLILKKATWKINKKQHPEFDAETTGKKIGWHEAFKAVQKKISLPDKVMLLDEEGELFLDLNSALAFNMCVRMLQNKEEIIFAESLVEDRMCFVSSPAGKHVSQLIIPFHRNIATPRARVRERKSDNKVQQRESLQRNFIPGDKWLYYKIYCNTSVADNILTQAVLPLTNELLNDGTIEKFFFVRYKDPDFHLRLRYYNSQNENFWIPVLNKLKAVVSSEPVSSMVHTTSLETYQRELERYGAELMEESETIFYHDSIAAMKSIALIKESADEKSSVFAGIKAINMFLENFNLGNDEKITLIKNTVTNYLREYDEKKLRSELNIQFNTWKNEIFEYLNALPAEGNLQLSAILEERSSRIKPVANVIRSYFGSNNRDKMNTLLLDYIHMFCNRFFTSNQRQYELLCFYILMKYYQFSKHLYAPHEK